MSPKPEKVSVARTAGWGALIGAPALLAKAILLGEDIPAETAAISGFMLGGMIIGAGLGAIFAKLKNASAS